MARINLSEEFGCQVQLLRIKSTEAYMCMSYRKENRGNYTCSKDNIHEGNSHRGAIEEAMSGLYEDFTCKRQNLHTIINWKVYVYEVNK